MFFRLANLYILLFLQLAPTFQNMYGKIREAHFFEPPEILVNLKTALLRTSAIIFILVMYHRRTGGDLKEIQVCLNNSLAYKSSSLDYIAIFIFLSIKIFCHQNHSTVPKCPVYSSKFPVTESIIPLQSLIHVYNLK